MKFTLLHWDVPNWKTNNLVNQNVVHDEYLYESSFRELYQHMESSVQEITCKEAGWLLIPAAFKDVSDESYDGAYKIDYDTGEMIPKYREDGLLHVQRAYTNITTVEFLVVDYDGGVTLEDAAEHWTGYEFFLYTTFNHLVDKDNGEGAVDRFRVVVKIKEPVSIDDYYKRSDSLLVLAGGNCDETTFSRGRAFYWPCKSKENSDDFIMAYSEGKSVDVLGLAENVVIKRTAKTATTSKYKNDNPEDNRAEIAQELMQCNFPSYNQWFQMVEAMCIAGYSEDEIYAVTLDNPNHATTTSGTPDYTRCRGHYIRFANKMGDEGDAVGKLVKWIQYYGNNKFRTKGYKKDKAINEQDQEIKRLEDLIANMNKKKLDNNKTVEV